MPPKRKQADDSTAEVTTTKRSTRASTRSSTSKAASTSDAKKSTKAAASTSALDGTEAEPAPPAKKAKTTTTKATGGRKRKGAATTDDSVPVRKPSSTVDSPSKFTNSNHVTEPSDATPPQPPPKANPPPKSGKQEVYSQQRARDLFKQYADGEDPTVIGAEGFEKLCSDAGLALDGPQALLLAWQFDTKEMMKITEEEWNKGTSTLKISSPSRLSQAILELDNLLMQDKPAVATTDKKDQPYDRAIYSGYAADTKVAFAKFYMFCFNLVKPVQSKNIEMETSVAFWSVLLAPKYPIATEVLEFIKEQGNTYKATNKDLWSMMLEFCSTISPSLGEYEADGAWPTLLDDFVAWKRSKTANGPSAYGEPNND